MRRESNGNFPILGHSLFRYNQSSFELATLDTAGSLALQKLSFQACFATCMDCLFDAASSAAQRKACTWFSELKALLNYDCWGES